MKLTRTKKILIGGALVTSFAMAQIPIPLGIGSLVYDPISDSNSAANWVAQHSAVATQILHAITTITQLKTTYDHMTAIAQPIKGTIFKWKSGITPWQIITSLDTYGKNSGWNSSMNNGVGILGSFNKITTQINNTVSTMPPTFQGAAQLAIAAIERHDGLIQGNAGVIGNYAAKQPAYQLMVENLAASAVTDDPNELTQRAVQQKNLSALMLQVQAANVGNELMKQYLQNSQAQLLMQRESAVNQVNIAANVYANAQSRLDESNVGTTNALHNLRIP